MCWLLFHFKLHMRNTKLVTSLPLSAVVRILEGGFADMYEIHNLFFKIKSYLVFTRQVNNNCTVK